MAKFNLFKRKSSEKAPKGFHSLTIKNITKLTPESVKVEFIVPEENKWDFEYEPGQYLDFELNVAGKKERRSYSICSDVNEDLAIGVKAIPNGTVSVWFNEEAVTGDTIWVKPPNGNFVYKGEKNIVAFASGS